MLENGGRKRLASSLMACDRGDCQTRSGEGAMLCAKTIPAGRRSTITARLGSVPSIFSLSQRLEDVGDSGGRDELRQPAVNARKPDRPDHFVGSRSEVSSE